MKEKEQSPHNKNPSEDLDPFEIEFLPKFRKNRGPEQPFINEFGVVIGDYDYESEHSPLEQWSTETDPAVMAGDQWVHPFKDIGFQTTENRNYFEQGIPPQSGIMMHPDKNVAYGYQKGQEAANEDSQEESEGEES
ncbi:DUF3905 domain-containing protein [Paenibacillus sp. J2TS4]|uniref:DUF3905 domain-containing protein n=1 Tax=Paenibacillus sp. J2TS4 TaxID=2807194 RepID=UPI001AFF0A55|nr:DUF3905 domain-containing protein [Paenibacillus sp. J2TS4]GIP34763.1 hypothetical protein J2TS4_39730 [Paenibacillus sp. J2TS4]